MKRYSEYKDSGVKWIGEIPRHWKVVAIKRLSEIILGKMLDKTNGNEQQYLCAKDVHFDGINLSNLKKMYFSPEEQNKYRIRKGDLLVVEGGACGTCAILRKEVNDIFIQNSIMIVRGDNTKCVNDFISYSIQALVQKGYTESVCHKATIMHFTKEKLGNTFISLPPLSDQEAIVTYLDAKVAKIDEYISIAEKKIAALEELKQTIIAEAVTRGIHKDVPMKDSGVKWIGIIPEHWKIEPFGRHFSYGKGLPITKADLTTEGVAVISYGQIHSKQNIGTTMDDCLVRYVNPKYIGTNPQCLLNKNDFVFADTSEDIEGCGNFAFNDRNESIFAGYHTIIVRPKDILQPKYYAYLFQSKKWKSQVQTLVNGVKVFSISRGILKKLSLLIPTCTEQQEIVTYLDSKVAKINQLCQAERSQIEKLKEYKQRLISDVVTGKVKVTND